MTTSFEEAVRYFQTTAQKLNKSTFKLDECLRAVNDLIVRSYKDEIAITVPPDIMTYVTGREYPESKYGDLTLGFGIHRFEYRADENDPWTEQLALGLMHTPEVDVYVWLPLVPLSGFGAPRLASRRLRVWAGQNLPVLISLLANRMASETEQVMAAADHAQEATGEDDPRTELLKRALLR